MYHLEDVQSVIGADAELLFLKQGHGDALFCFTKYTIMGKVEFFISLPLLVMQETGRLNTVLEVGSQAQANLKLEPCLEGACIGGY